MRTFSVLAFLLAGCAAQASAPKLWTQTTANKWEYDQKDAQLGEVDLNSDGAFDAIGCGSDAGPFVSLQSAKNFVETSCAQASQ